MPEPDSNNSRVRQQIIAIVLDFIVERGVAEVTYRRIATAAKMPLGSMTYYFPTKDDMLFAAFQEFATTSSSTLTQSLSEEGNPLDNLTALVFSTTTAKKREQLLVAELYVLAHRKERFADLLRTWMQQASQTFSEVFPGRAANLVDALQEGVALQQHFQAERFTPQQVRQALALLATVETAAGE